MFAKNYSIFNMLTFTNQVDLKQHLATKNAYNLGIGFVPTMGALHIGHLSLVQQSLSENMFTVVSIFVNPTQFNNPDDLKKYPRTLESDTEKIKSVSDKVIIYAPTVADIYPKKAVSEHFDFDGLEHQMEGKHRPGHFDGVGTVVKRLFEIVNPTKAYFGKKDFQQLQIVKKLVEKLNLKVQIIGCEIYREPNGLAMSSRNVRLSAKDRMRAKIIFETLSNAKTRFEKQSAQQVTNWVAIEFKKYPEFKLEYFEIADQQTLLSCNKKQKNKTYRAFIAVFIGEVRLIDTLVLE